MFSLGSNYSNIGASSAHVRGSQMLPAYPLKRGIFLHFYVLVEPLHAECGVCEVYKLLLFLLDRKNK